MNKTGLISILLLMPFFISGQDISRELKFSRESWNIGLEGFSGLLSNEYNYLKSSIPDLIRKELASSDVHVLSPKEISYYRRTVVEEADNKLIAEMTSQYIARDQLIFNGDSTSTSYKSIDDKINLLKDQRINLAFLDQNLIKTADMLKVNWVGTSGDEIFINADQYQPSVISKESNLDFLIYGNVREIEGYFLIEVLGYDRSSDKILSVYKGSGSIDEIELMAAEASNELRSIILGRPWSSLIVTLDHPDALIYSNGELIGIGSAVLNTASPGNAFLEAVGEDNSYWSREVVLKALETNEYSGILSPVDTDFLVLDSLPEQADVYIGARWVGKTPLNVPRYHQRNIWVTVKSEGYYDKSFEVSVESPGDLLVEMIEEDMTELEIFNLRKKEFYRSLGWFSISVAGPVVSGGIFSNYASRQNAYAYEYYTTSDIKYRDLADDMERNYYISYGVFWGTIGVSGGLLADVFVKLSRYIKAAEALAD